MFPYPEIYTEKGLDLVLAAISWKIKYLMGIRPETEHTVFLRNFISEIEGKAKPLMSTAEARDAVELCTALYTSAITKQAVDLPLDASHRFYSGIQKKDYFSSNNKSQKLW